MNDTQHILPLEGPPPKPPRVDLPTDRRGTTIKFEFGDEGERVKGYMTHNAYPDGSLGEVFLRVAKAGSFMEGILNALSISISIGLQHGIPLETYVSKFASTRFGPMGITGDQEVPFAKSVLDYVFRKLALRHLDDQALEELNLQRRNDLQVEADREG